MNNADNRPAVVGKVERPVRPGSEARWYCLSRDGMATLCVDELDARYTAKKADKDWRASSPHRAVQLVDVATVAAERERIALAWDGCRYEGMPCDMDIGASIRAGALVPLDGA